MRLYKFRIIAQQHENEHGIMPAIDIIQYVIAESSSHAWRYAKNGWEEMSSKRSDKPDIKLLAYATAETKNCFNECDFHSI